MMPTSLMLWLSITHALCSISQASQVLALTMPELGRLYSAAKLRVEEDPEFAARVSTVLDLLQRGSAGDSSLSAVMGGGVVDAGAVERLWEAVCELR